MAVPGAEPLDRNALLRSSAFRADPLNGWLGSWLPWTDWPAPKNYHSIIPRRALCISLPHVHFDSLS
jgi:hypothetical protein